MEKKDEKTKASTANNVVTKRTNRRLPMKWFSWPSWLITAYQQVSIDLAGASRSFCRGAYADCITDVVKVWLESKSVTGKRAALIAKWLPELYFRYIGLANLFLTFDIYQLAMQVAAHLERPKSADAAIDTQLLANVLARCVAARTRILTPKSQTRMLFLPEHHQNPVSKSTSTSSSPIWDEIEAVDERLNVKGWPLLWQTPPAVVPTLVPPSKTDLADEECQTEEMQRGMYETEWTKLLVGSSIIRKDGVTRGELFEFAIWLETLRNRGGMDTTVFLHCLDTICASSSTSSANFFRDVVDPDGRYTQTIRLFMRTLRAFIVHDIGHRIYAMFYWMVMTRSIDSSAARLWPLHHHHVSNLTHFTDLDAHAPPTQHLAQIILVQLGAATAESAAAEAAVTTKSSSSSSLEQVSGRALPIATSPWVLNLSNGMDWSHPFAQGWVRKMDIRFNAPSLEASVKLSSASASGRRLRKVDADEEELQRHLKSINTLVLDEIGKYFPVDSQEIGLPMEEVDEGTLVPLPEIYWGETRRAKIENTGRLWVGPFDADCKNHRQIAGRALFVSRKFQEWKLHTLTVVPVKKKIIASSAAAPAEFWLRYDGMPRLTPAQETELRRITNVTQAQLIEDYRTIDIMDASQIHPYRLVTPSDTISPKYAYGIIQYFALQLARAILGVAETASKRDTLILNPNNGSILTVIPTATFIERSLHSYRASFATIQKIARAKKQMAERNGTNNDNTNNNSAPNVSKWLVRLFGRRGATVIAQRGSQASQAKILAAETENNAESGLASSAVAALAKRKELELKQGREQEAKSLLSYLSEEDVRNADATAVLFGRPMPQKSGIGAYIRDAVNQRAAFMMDVRARLVPFYEALKREKELPHLRAALAAIHRTMPLALTPELVLAHRLQHSAISVV